MRNDIEDLKDAKREAILCVTDQWPANVEIIIDLCAGAIV